MTTCEGESEMHVINHTVTFKINCQLSFEAEPEYMLADGSIVVPLFVWVIKNKYSKRIQRGFMTKTSNNSYSRNAFMIGRYRDFSDNILICLNTSEPWKANTITGGNNISL